MARKNYDNKLWKKAVGSAFISVLLVAAAGCNSSDDAAVESTTRTSSPGETTAQNADADIPPRAELYFKVDENGEFPLLVQGQNVYMDASSSTVSDPESATFVVTTSDGQMVEPDADGEVVLNFQEDGVHTITLTVTDSQGRSDENWVTTSVLKTEHYERRKRDGESLTWGQ